MARGFAWHTSEEYDGYIDDKNTKNKTKFEKKNEIKNQKCKSIDNTKKANYICNFLALQSDAHKNAIANTQPQKHTHIHTDTLARTTTINKSLSCLLQIWNLDDDDDDKKEDKETRIQ